MNGMISKADLERMARRRAAEIKQDLPPKKLSEQEQLSRFQDQVDTGGDFFLQVLKDRGIESLRRYINRMMALKRKGTGG